MREYPTVVEVLAAFDVNHFCDTFKAFSDNELLKIMKKSDFNPSNINTGRPMKFNISMLQNWDDFAEIFLTNRDNMGQLTFTFLENVDKVIERRNINVTPLLSHRNIMAINITDPKSNLHIFAHNRAYDDFKTVEEMFNRINNDYYKDKSIIICKEGALNEDHDGYYDVTMFGKDTQNRDTDILELILPKFNPVCKVTFLTYLSSIDTEYGYASMFDVPEMLSLMLNQDTRQTVTKIFEEFRKKNNQNV